MVDAISLVLYVRTEVCRFRDGDLSLPSLVSRLEYVVAEAERLEVADLELLADAWERLEVYNALALNHRDKSVLHLWWGRRARRALVAFECVARQVLEPPGASTP